MRTIASAGAARCVPIGFSGGACRPELGLLRERELRDAPPGRPRRARHRCPPRPASVGRTASAPGGRRAARGSSHRRAPAAPPRGGPRPQGRASGSYSTAPSAAAASPRPSGVLALLGQVREEARRPGQDGHGADDARREPEVEHDRGDRHRDVHRERPAPLLLDGTVEPPGEGDVGGAHAARVGELEDPLGARIDGPVHGMAEPRDPAARGVDRTGDVRRRPSGGLRLFEQARTLARGAEDDRPGTEDPGRDGPLKGVGVRRERHARRDVRRHQPVLGDRHQEQVEEEALLLARLLAGQQQVDVRGERQASHQVARQVAAAHVDAVGVGLGDPRLHG